MTTLNLYPDPLMFRLARWQGDVAVMALQHYQRYATSAGWITVPTGFETDGLSIPRTAWPIVGPANGPAFRAGILHDYLYSKASNRLYGDITRSEADDLFLETMYNLGIGWARRHTIYTAVRMFGWRHYKRK